jgi:predicted nucleic acid-binding protein
LLKERAMPSGRLRYYWDTAPLIAWITDEKRDDPSEMSGLAEVVEMVERQRAVLMTSVLWRAEVLDLHLTQMQRRKLDAVFDGQNVIELQIDSRIMDLTSEIRNFHRASKKKDAIKQISVPDAIHLASAIHYNASEFHTFDGKRAGKNPGGLLTLNGNVAGHRLKICSPRAVQMRIEDATPDDPIVPNDD